MALIDTGAAAFQANVTTAAIRKWTQRGKLVKLGTDDQGRNLYDLGSVLRLAARLRDRALT